MLFQVKMCFEEVNLYQLCFSNVSKKSFRNFTEEITSENYPKYNVQNLMFEIFSKLCIITPVGSKKLNFFSFTQVLFQSNSCFVGMNLHKLCFSKASEIFVRNEIKGVRTSNVRNNTSKNFCKYKCRML